ncbi:hypothetical protein OG937_44815 [Streptomyces sp. NBC_00510]
MPSIPDADHLRRVAPVRDGTAAAPPVLHAGAGEPLCVHGPTGSRPPGNTGEEAGLPLRPEPPPGAGTHRAPEIVDDLDMPVTGPGHLAGR